MVKELRFFLKVVKAILTQGEHVNKEIKWPFEGYCPVYNIILGICVYLRLFLTKCYFSYAWKNTSV